jgi:hypothetical protein
MKPFDVFANITAAAFVWVIVTAFTCVIVMLGSDESPGQWFFWPWVIAILIVSVVSFRLYVRHIWKKLDL